VELLQKRLHNARMQNPCMLNFLLLREGRVALAKDAWLGGAGGGVIARVQGSEVQLTPAFVPLRCRRRKTTALPENAHGNAVTTVILP
jgi:hypothetical protein